MQRNHRPAAQLAAVRSPRLLLAAAAVVTLAAAIVALHPSATQAAPAKVAIVSTAKTSLGRILVDSRGHTLYLFEKDRHGKSSCSGQCATFWPPLITSGKPRVARGARASLVGTTKRPDGRLQVTYNHHPLYTFAKDKKAGDVKGEAFSAFGAEWYVVSTAGSKIDKDDSSGGSYGSFAHAG